MIKRIHYSPNFQKNFSQLPVRIQNKFEWCMSFIVTEEKHNSLRHKKIQGTKNQWEFSITMNYRCIYMRIKNEIFLLSVGTHDEVF